jgi:cytochrome P450 PksS
MTEIIKLDMASPRFKANPYPFYARLRQEAPVCPVTLKNGMKVWLVTRYDDVSAVLKDERFIKDKTKVLNREQAARQPRIPKMFLPLSRNMLDVDAPDHPRLRGLVHHAFTPRLVDAMRQRVQSLTHEFLDAVAAKGRMDIIRDYAVPLPTTIISELLGVPARDRHKFHRWTSAIVSSDPFGWGMIMMLPRLIALLRYIKNLVKLRRAEPKEDLLSALVMAEEAGEKLSEDELVSMVALLLIAGHETTVNLIGNGTLALLEHPDQMEKLRGDPAIIKPAIEEMLRYDSPLETATERFTREDVSIDGVMIPRGEMVFSVIASANRDPAQFERPDTLDLTREPNRHLTFGQGVHYCLGAPLARLEGQIAMNTLLGRMSDLRLAVPSQSLRWRRGLVLRGLEALPVTFTKSRPVGLF